MKDTGNKVDGNQTLDENCSFFTFWQANPTMRFWQAIKEWSGFGYVLVADSDNEVPRDTYYFEGKRN